MDIEKLTDNLINQLKKNTNNSIDNLKSYMLNELKRMELDKGKVDLTSKSNVERLKRLKSMLVTKLSASGYEKGIKEVVKDFDSVIDVYNQNTEANVNDIPRLKVLQKTTLKEIGGRSGLVTNKIRNEFDTYLKKGGLFKALLNNIESGLNSYKSAAYTIGNTGVQMASRVVNADIAEQLGIDWFTYSGNKDRITRQFCKDILNGINPNTKAPNFSGRYWHISEIRKLDNGQIANCLDSGGGYNCRHDWLQVSQAKNAELNEKYSSKIKN